MSALRSTVLLTAVSLFSQAVRFVYQILLSRAVGAQVMGLFHLVMPVMPVLMSLTALGLTAACSSLTARCKAVGDRAGAAGAVSASVRVFLPVFSAVALVTAIFSDAVSVKLLGDARTRLGLLLLLPCVLLTGLENIHKHYFYGMGRVRPPAFTEVLEQLIRTGAVLGLLALLPRRSPEETVGIIVCGMILCEVFSALTLTALFRRETAGARPAEPGQTAQVLRIALPIGLTALLGNLMDAWTTVLIPRRLIRAGQDVDAAMAAFGVLKGMTMPMLALPAAFLSALGLVLLPRMSQAHALGDKELCRTRADRALTAAVGLMLPAAVLLAVLAPTLGRLVFHEPSAGDYALPLALGLVLSGAEGVLAVCLNGLGKQDAAALHRLLSGGVELAITWWRMGVPGLGLRGYVEAMLAGTVLGLVLHWRTLRRAIGIRAAWSRWAVAPGLSAALAGLCVDLLLPALTSAGLGEGAACAACLSFGGILYFCAMAAQGAVDI